MTLNVNKSTPTSYELSITNIPTRSTEETTSVLLQIYQTVIPGIDIPTIDTPFMGRRVHRDSTVMDFQDWNISFFVDADFSNWKILFDWIVYITQIDQLPSHHNINAVLSLKNDFGQEVMKLFFTDVWIKNLGEVSLNAQAGDEFLQSTAIFDYGHFDVYEPDEEVTG
jgi:hypothetical protein